MSAESMDRLMHWYRLARELDQEDDFRALLDDVRREALEEARRPLARTGHDTSRLVVQEMPLPPQPPREDD